MTFQSPLQGRLLVRPMSRLLFTSAGVHVERAIPGAQRSTFDPSGPTVASNDAQRDNLGAAFEGDCRFEIFREDEEGMTSTRFSGGDWRWRLVSTEGLILAEASGYRNEGLCRAAVVVLQQRAATASIVPASEHT